MADLVQIARIDDQMSAGAASATAALGKLADAGDKVDTTISRIGKSATSFVGKLDPVTKSANALTKAQNELAAAQISLADGLAKGTVTQDQANRSLDTLAAKVQAARKAMDQLGDPAVVSNTNKVSFAMRDLGLQSIDMFQGLATGQPIFRTFIQQGAQVAQVNAAMGVGFKEMTSGLLGLITPAVAVVAGVAAVAAGVVAFGVVAESNQRRLLDLQTALRGTRDDYIAMGNAADAAARKASLALPGVSSADALAAAKSISAAPNFGGTTAQIQQLISVANDAARVLGVTLPDEAKAFAEALADPGKAAQELADKHLLGMNQALAHSIELQAQAGDKAGAFARYMDQVTAATKGAAKDGMTPLQQALADLDIAFKGVNSSGESFSKWFGQGLNNVVLTLVEQLKEILDLVHTAQQFVSSSPAMPTVDDYGRVVPGAASSNATGAQQIRDIGSQLGVSSQVTDFGIKIATQEGGGQIRHTDASGNLITSPAGAQGEFQLMPATAAGLGVNPANQTENIAGGLTLISKLMTKYRGDPALVAMAYNWGEGNVDKFLAGVKSTADVPKETSDYVKAIAGVSVGSIPTHGAIDVSGGSNTYGATNGDLVGDQYKKALGAGGPTVDYEKAKADAAGYSAALDAMAASGDKDAEKQAVLTDGLMKAQKAMYDAIGPAAGLVRGIDIQTASVNSIGDAYAGGYAAVQKATIATQAQAQVIASGINPKMAQWKSAVDAVTDALTRQSVAQQNNAGRAVLLDQGQQLDYLKAEVTTLGESAEQRAVDLATLKQIQEIEKSRPAELDSIKQAEIANAQATARTTYEYQQQQQALQEIGNMATQIADQIGNAITQAFVSGQGAAVNWGNVMRGVMASVLQEVAKLAIINPILNSITGGSATTLGGVIGALGASSGGSSSGGSSLLSTGGSLLSTGSSISGFFGGPSIGSMLGLTGPGGLLTGAGSGLGSFLAMDTGIGATGLGGIGAEGAYSAAQVAASGTAGASVGSLLGGAGIGFAGGSFAGSLLQGALGKTGPAPMIGAGIGTGIGALVGGPVGAIIGGVIGGGAGGLIGPSLPSSYSSAALSLGNGGITKGAMIQQGDITRAAATDQALTSALAGLNTFLSSNGVTVSGQKGFVQIGDNSNKSAPDPTKFADLNTANMTGQTALQQFRFSSSQAPIQHLLDTNTYADTTSLETAITQAKAFIDTTVPQLLALGKAPTTEGSFVTQINSLSTSFTQAITNAKQLGMSTDDLSAAWSAANDNAASVAAKPFNDAATGFQQSRLAAQATVDGSPAFANAVQLNSFDAQAQQQRDSFTAQLVAVYGDAYKTTAEYGTRMEVLEESLGEQRLAIQTQYNKQMEAAVQAITSTDTGLTSRYVAAGATLTGSPQDALNAQLYAFDTQASQQRYSLSKQLTDTFGDSYKTTSDYATHMALLEKTLGEERLVIVKQSSDQIAAATAAGQQQAMSAVQQTVSSIASYADSLSTSSASPLSALDQYSLANDNFGRVSTGAASGDFNSLQSLTSGAQSFLATSRNVNGSGAAYVADFNRVLDVLQQAAGQSTDTLTASAFVSETRTQTATLVDSLAALQSEVAALRRQVAQTGATPARVAA